MKHQHIILTRNQWIGIIVLLLLLALIFAGLHFLPSPSEIPSLDSASVDTIKNAIIHQKKHYYDSLRAIRTAKYDSLRLVRRDSLYQIYREHRDSLHQADSLWWDSVKQTTPHLIKKDTLLSLNHADTTELKMIRGIGSGMARRIVRYREQLGGFTSVSQLQDDQLYQDQYGHSIRSKYCIPDSVLINFYITENDSIHTIPINHASIERLQAHPYISHSLAKEIYLLRRQKVVLKHIDELRGLAHSTDSVLMRIEPYLSFEK